MLSVYEAPWLTLKQINEEVEYTLLPLRSPKSGLVWFITDANVMDTQRNEVGKSLDAEGDT